jgi:hypothetical protein
MHIVHLFQIPVKRCNALRTKSLCLPSFQTLILVYDELRMSYLEPFMPTPAWNAIAKGGGLKLIQFNHF